MDWFSKRRKRSDLTEGSIFPHIDGDFTVYPLGEGRASKAQLEVIEKSLDVRFPEEFVDHVIGVFPGTIVMANEQIWPRPDPFTVAPFWRFLYAVHSFTPLTTSEDWMRLDIVGRRFQDQTGHRAVPILKVMGDADVYCTDAHGEILAFDHELNTLTPVELDFWALLEREVQELVARKNRFIAEPISGT